MKMSTQDKWGWLAAISFVIMLTTIFTKYQGDLIVVTIAIIGTLVGIIQWNKEI